MVATRAIECRFLSPAAYFTPNHVAVTTHARVKNAGRDWPMKDDEADDPCRATAWSAHEPAAASDVAPNHMCSVAGRLRMKTSRCWMPAIKKMAASMNIGIAFEPTTIPLAACWVADSGATHRTYPRARA